MIPPRHTFYYDLVVKEILFADAVWGVVGAVGIFDQDARFQPGALLLANPGEFEFWFGLGHGYVRFLVLIQDGLCCYAQIMPLRSAYLLPSL